MQKTLLSLTLLLGLAVAWAVQSPPAPADNGFAVVELFTSEGCSSCPPAEAEFARLVGSNKNVYPLLFHVDYWDRLGWKDPFSQSQFTRRQQRYAHDLPSQVYTPQAVINGRSECVGSNSSTLHGLVTTALSHSERAHLKLSARVTNGAVAVDFQVVDGPTGNVALALVENGLEIHVGSGENSGRTLAHPNVVRVFRETTARQGHEVLNLPPGAKLSNCSVVAFLSESNGQIAGATSASLR